ncbi:MAG: prepilin-type N-terminal cleavage/methylation domain-containing protein [Planctomycetes bacterium]|nr:prepilin-type N-terminal cleavage/methylation domain-containing protein [Planctomycetota bacterium]
MLTPNRIRRGFTLIEILAVVVILGILAVVVVPRVLTSSATAKTNACYQNKASINTAVEKYYFDTGGWPADALTDIGADADYFPDGIPACPVDGTTYALSTTTHRVTGHAH